MDYSSLIPVIQASNLEKEIFISQIEQVTEMTKCVKEIQQQLANQGFNK